MLRRRTKPATSANGTMTLLEHLRELRRRVFFAFLGLFAGLVVCFVWFSVGIPAIGLPTLGDILKYPYCSVSSPPRVQIGDEGCTFLATEVFSALQIRMKASLLAGSVLSSPVWVYQLWAFITPGLYAKERKYAVIVVSIGATLVSAGAVLAYFVLSTGLSVILRFGGDTTVAALNPEKYFSFLIALLLIFGVSFLLPLLLVMLNQIGMLSAAKLSAARRYAAFGIVVFAGLVVPGNDPFTMLALALSLIILYELSVQICRVHDKRRARNRAAETFSDLPDDQASPMPLRDPQVDHGDAT